LNQSTESSFNISAVQDRTNASAWAVAQSVGGRLIHFSQRIVVGELSFGSDYTLLVG
jgi:hypothetical protein